MDPLTIALAALAGLVGFEVLLRIINRLVFWNRPAIVATAGV